MCFVSACLYRAMCLTTSFRRGFGLPACYFGVLSCACVLSGGVGAWGRLSTSPLALLSSVGSGPSSACGVYVGAGPPA